MTNGTVFKYGHIVEKVKGLEHHTNLGTELGKLFKMLHYVPGIKNDGNAIRKNHLYLELDRVTFRNYAEKMLMPQYSGLSKKQIYALCDLRSIEQTLANDPRITVFHNIDDFLLSEDDRKFLDRTLGNKLIWFNHGGHLGNFYIKKVQDMIADQVVSKDNRLK